MSPASLRRYRAERLLREEFRSLSARVMASARGRLRACGVRLDEADLEACYAQAWQGLYAATLAGQPIHNPAGWLAVATFRRAIEEHRARAHVGVRDCCAEPETQGRDALHPRGHPAEASAAGRDAAAELDRRIELRRVFEALRLRLNAREQQAAALCYLQGLSRAEAAASMGVSEARMRKLMEGRGAGRPGVAGKVSALLATIREGTWCEEQASLMRGFAYGILDPAGERYRCALAHASACPACRAYVASLRGLAALLPPMPALLGLVLAGARSAKASGLGAALGHGGAGVSGLGGGATAGAKGAAGAGAGSPSAGAGAGLASTGAMPSATASGVASAGAAGGGWLVAGGGVGAKLAAGCLLALGAGAGCAVLGMSRAGAGAHGSAHVRRHANRFAHAADAAASLAAARVSSSPGATGRAPAITARAGASSAASQASREFGPEQVGAPAPAEPSSPPRASSTPRRAAGARVARAGAEFTSEEAARSSAPAPETGVTAQASRPSAAQREFSPG
jgi:DNA-directed RNA polymerase specialized sigma24 family protein